MKDLTKEWVARALEHKESAVYLATNGLFNDSCFHSQQTAELLLKAVLMEKNFKISKTHDLALLLSDIRNLGIVVPNVDTYCEVLRDYAIKSRYPGIALNEEDAVQALGYLNMIETVVFDILDDKLPKSNSFT